MKQDNGIRLQKGTREYYLPKNRPEIIDIPSFKAVAVEGKGNPNDKDGAYQKAIGILYAIAYTIKMSRKTDHQMDDYFNFVVPPLEGFWWQEDTQGIDYDRKDDFNWISFLRLPDFVTQSEFTWAVENVQKKKKLDCSQAWLMECEEGLCVQIMHHGSFDTEPETVKQMDAYLMEHGYVNDFSERRMHHEIYLSDARKVPPEKWKTVIRHPIRKK